MENLHSSLDVREYYHKFFGVVISTSSLSRMIADLKDLGFIEGIQNPHGSQKLSWLRLTMKGRKLQKLFIGTTSDWKDQPSSDWWIDNTNKHVHINRKE